MTEQEQRPSSGRHRAAKPGKPPKASKSAKAPKAERPAKTAHVAQDFDVAGPSRGISTGAATIDATTAPEIDGGSRRRLRLVLSLVAALTLACVAGAIVLLILADSKRSTPASAKAAPAEAVSKAVDDVQRILSYDYRSVASDIDTAKSVMTGQLLTDYNSSANKVLTQAGPIKAIVKATVSGQAVVRAQSDRVTLLLYVDQESVKQLKGAKTPTTRIDPLRIQLTMSKVKGRWLASDLQPL